MNKFRKICLINVILLITVFSAVAFAVNPEREEWIFYGDTIDYEYPPSGRGPAPETLVVLWCKGNDAPAQPVPDFWESIWDIDLDTPFSITKFYKKISYEASMIYAYPRAHWTGTYYYCFDVDAPTPTHLHTGWYLFYRKAIEAADPEIDFSEYAQDGEDVYVVVLAIAPGGGSGIYSGGYLIPTNDYFPSGAPVYVRAHYGVRGDAWAWHGHMMLNIHEYGHNWLPDLYKNYYEMGSFCGHYGYGFCQYHSWVDLIPSPINPQWRSEMLDKNTNEPWLTPTEISETQLNYPIMPMQETYNGEVLRIKINASEAYLSDQSFLVTNHQNLAPYEINFPDSGLLIWHIRNTAALGYWYNNRRAREIDVECAHGLWQWDSTEVGGEWTWWTTTEDPVYGTDSLDMYNYTLRQGVYPPTGDPDWKGFGSATCMWDPETYTRFDAFTNPPSNLYDKWDYPLCPEYIHSHFALRNIHPDPTNETIVRADILLNYVQSDVPTATSYNNSRQIVSDASGNLYMVYETGGYVYFTSANLNDMIWEPAFPVGKGKSPTIALDNSNVPNIIWVSNDSLFWAKRQNYYTWPTHALFYPPPVGWEAYYCLTPSFVFDNVGYGHIVFEKFTYANGPISRLHYGKLDPANPGLISWELVDIEIMGDRCQYPSVAVDGADNPNVSWQKADEIYYRYKQDGIWSAIANISNSPEYLSYTPFLEIATDWLHIVWVEEPYIPPDNISNIRHVRKDLSTGLWYPPQWVNNSAVYSKSPQTIDGDQIVWTEHEIPNGNIEVYHSKWDYVTGSWGPPENISNTVRSSTAPQVTKANDGMTVNDYLVTVWCEDDGVLYEVRKDKRLLPEPMIFHYIELGAEEPSPYTVERDGFIAYGPEDYKTVDYDSTKLIYRIPGFEEGYKYTIKFVLYHEGASKWKLKIRIDDRWTRNIWVHPYQLTAVGGIIPEGLIKDGEIVVTDEVTQGELAVLSSIIIYRKPKGQGGGPQTLVDIENRTGAFTIHPSIVSNKAEIHYQIDSPGSVNISVFDISGRKVKTLINENQELGHYRLVWNGSDDPGRKLSKGIYFIRFENQKEIVTQKVVILK